MPPPTPLSLITQAVLNAGGQVWLAISEAYRTVFNNIINKINEIIAFIGPVAVNESSTKLACYAAELRTTLPAYTRVGNVCTANAVGAFPALDGGITLVAGTGFRSRFLVIGAAHADLGIYTLTDAGGAGTQAVWTRATDMDSDADVVNGAVVPVVFGNSMGPAIWRLATAPVITLNTTAISFATPMIAASFDYGVQTAQIADDAVTNDKINSSAFSNLTGLSGGSGNQVVLHNYLAKVPATATVGAVWSTIFTVTIVDGNPAYLTARIFGQGPPGRAGFVVHAVFERTAGVVTQIGPVGGNVLSQAKDAGMVASDIRAVASGGTMVVQALGVAGDTVNWGGDIWLNSNLLNVIIA